MLNITSPYPYKEFKRKSVNGKRLYENPYGEPVPSVTTILSKTKDMTHLNAWKKRVGENKAAEITKEAAGRGTRMHAWLEQYVKEDRVDDPGSNPYSQQSHKMANIIVEQGLDKMDECWGTEVSLYFPQVYAGTTDCVGLYNGIPAIIDFKQSNKSKKREWIEDYFLQLCAYGDAHNEVYGTDIETGVVLMCTQDYQFQTWTISGDEYRDYSRKWWARVGEYYGA